jgi:hypothetical protein
MIRDHAAALGFTMTMSEESRIYNTFDAHRLLHWAEEAGNWAALHFYFAGRSLREDMLERQESGSVMSARPTAARSNSPRSIRRTRPSSLAGSARRENRRNRSIGRPRRH